MSEANERLVFASEKEFEKYMERRERQEINDILATLSENDPFFEHFSKGEYELCFCLSLNYPWDEAPETVREYAEKVSFPKDRNIIIFCHFFVNHTIHVDPFFIRKEDDTADLDDVIVSFDDFPAIDFSPLYEFVADEAKSLLTARGYDMSAFEFVT